MPDIAPRTASIVREPLPDRPVRTTAFQPSLDTLSDRLGRPRRLSPKGAFPNGHYAPTQGTQCFRLFGVPSLVRREFRCPEGIAGLGDRRAMAAVRVPVASMDENYGTKPWKYEIGTAW